MNSLRCKLAYPPVTKGEQSHKIRDCDDDGNLTFRVMLTWFYAKHGHPHVDSSTANTL